MQHCPAARPGWLSSALVQSQLLLGVSAGLLHALGFTCRVRTVVFDKTGTLTAGKPHVVDVKVLHSQLTSGDVVQLAAAVEQHSEHPIAAAILALLQQQQLKRQQSAGKAGGGTPGNAVVPLPTSNVDVTVGEGISGWLQLPSAAGAAGGSSSGQNLNWAALLEVLAAPAGSGGISATAGGPAEAAGGGGLEGLVASAAASAAAPASPKAAQQPASRPDEVLVRVGNTRLMAEAGVVVPQAAAAYMRDKEVRLGCSGWRREVQQLREHGLMDSCAPSCAVPSNPRLHACLSYSCPPYPAVLTLSVRLFRRLRCSPAAARVCWWRCRPRSLE